MSKINESIVLVGGGGGVYRVAKFLKRIRPNLTTIQTVFDHGGHSGHLRDERGVLPPGDIRQAILALADDNLEPTWRELLGFRFRDIGGSSLNGATVGNILLTALSEIEGSLPVAINLLCKLFKVKGKVLPVSLDDSELCVELSDGSVLKGEGEIDTRSKDDDRKIVRAFLEPEAEIFVETYEALVNATKIVFCPGDLYTSLVPNLLVNGFKEALEATSAKIILVTNIMTKKAETDSFKVSDFVQTVSGYAGRKMDVVVCNSAKITPELEQKYKTEKSEMVDLGFIDPSLCSSYKHVDLVDATGGIIRHHARVANVIAGI